MIRLEKRLQPSRTLTSLTPILAVILTMIIGGLMFALLGKPPFESIRIIFWDPLFNPQFAAYSRPQLLIKAAPLILIAIGLSIGFRAGIWNIGAEGQYIIGAICGAGMGLAFYPADLFIIFPLMVITGAFGGWAWAMIPALLKTRFGTNEILVSLMLVYVAESLLASVSSGLLKNPDGMGFPGSRNLQQYPAAANTELFTNTGMHWGVVACFIAVIFAYVVLTRHLQGFHIRLTGQAPRAARFVATPHPLRTPKTPKSPGGQELLKRTAATLQLPPEEWAEEVSSLHAQLLCALEELAGSEQDAERSAALGGCIAKAVSKIRLTQSRIILVWMLFIYKSFPSYAAYSAI